MCLTDGILQRSLALEYSGRWVTFRLVVCGAEEHEATVLRGHETPLTRKGSHSASMGTPGLWLASTLWCPYLVLHIFYL